MRSTLGAAFGFSMLVAAAAFACTGEESAPPTAQPTVEGDSGADASFSRPSEPSGGAAGGDTGGMIDGDSGPPPPDPNGTCAPPGVEHLFASVDDFAAFVRARRWLRCTLVGAGQVPTADGIEFSDAGTYTLLAEDDAGALTPLPGPEATGSVEFLWDGPNTAQMNLSAGPDDGGIGTLTQIYGAIMTDSPRQLRLDDAVVYVPETDAGWPETEVTQPSIGTPLPPPAICAQPLGAARAPTSAIGTASLLADDWIACGTGPGQSGFGQRPDQIGVRFNADGTCASLVHAGDGTIDVANDLPNGGTWKVTDVTGIQVDFYVDQGLFSEVPHFYDSPSVVVLENGTSLTFVRRSETGL